MFVEGGSGKPERDIWSLDSLISWLEEKNPKRSYNFMNCYECLLAQYFQEMGKGFSVVSRSTLEWHEDGEYHCRELPPNFDDIAAGSSLLGRGLRGSWTFGKALKRARRVKAHSNASPARGLLGHLANVFGL